MRVLVIGYGSIGSRHVGILKEMGFSVSVFSARKNLPVNTFHSLEDAMILDSPEYVVVANKTHEDYATLIHLVELGFAGQVLVEKPLSHAIHALLSNKFKGGWVGYNLRFHPLIQ